MQMQFTCQLCIIVCVNYTSALKITEMCADAGITWRMHIPPSVSDWPSLRTHRKSRKFYKSRNQGQQCNEIKNK